MFGTTFTKYGMLLTGACFVLAAQSANAANILLNGFENTLNGYSATGGDPTLSFNGFSTTTGVTQGTYSATINSAGGVTGYGQFLQSGYTTANTTALNGATSINFDAFAPSGSFGGYLQFKVQIQFNDTGYTYIDLGGFDGAHSVNLGSETSLSFAISPTVQAQIATAAAAGNATNLYISIGTNGTANAGDSIQLDNLTVTTPTPEPASLGLLGLAGTSLLARRRKA